MFALVVELWMTIASIGVAEENDLCLPIDWRVGVVAVAVRVCQIDHAVKVIKSVRGSTKAVTLPEKIKD
jgi:hypothetical protein